MYAWVVFGLLESTDIDAIIGSGAASSSVSALASDGDAFARDTQSPKVIAEGSGMSPRASFDPSSAATAVSRRGDADLHGGEALHQSGDLSHDAFGRAF